MLTITASDSNSKSIVITITDIVTVEVLFIIVVGCGLGEKNQILTKNNTIVFIFLFGRFSMESVSVAQSVSAFGC